jgi:hypothetical protein
VSAVTAIVVLLGGDALAVRQVAQIRREERRLKVRCVELAETVKAKRAEAEASLARQRTLRAEVNQLRAAVEASEKADSSRIHELHMQVGRDSLLIVVTVHRGAGPGMARRRKRDHHVCCCCTHSCCG